MFWLYVLAVIIVGSLVGRWLTRGRRSPVIDDSRLTDANYERLNQELRSFDQRFGQHGG